jgi:hypothetical protein
LFDTKVNHAICEQIVAQQLFQTESLSQLMRSHRREALELLQFISKHQDLPMVIDPSLPGKSQSTPSPTSTLTSVEGMLTFG